METTERKGNVGLTFGLIAGLIVCVITLLQYLGGLDTFLSPVGSVIYLVIVTFAVLAALKVRRENEGFLEFKQALKVTFTVFASALLLHTLFSYVLLNFIDPDFKSALTQEVFKKTEPIMRRFGATDEQIEAERTKDQYSLGRVMAGYAVTCIVSFIFCLLISVIVKRSKPAFNNI